MNYHYENKLGEPDVINLTIVSETQKVPQPDIEKLSANQDPIKIINDALLKLKSKR